MSNFQQADNNSDDTATSHAHDLHNKGLKKGQAEEKMG